MMRWHASVRWEAGRVSVPDERRHRSGDRPLVERLDARRPELGEELREAVLALHLPEKENEEREGSLGVRGEGDGMGALFPISTHMVVLNVSTGMRKMRKSPAATEAATVFAATGSFSVVSYASNSANVPVLAAVSPNLDSGPCTSAGIRPR